jgi:hypothetical protein
MERRVDNPVEVVGQDADVSILTKRRVRNKVDAFARSDNGLALFGVEQVGGSTEALYNRMWLMCSWGWGGRQWNGVWRRGVEDGVVVVRRLAARAWCNFDDSEVLLERFGR